MNDKNDKPLFDTDDAALMIGRQMIEIYVLRKGLDKLRAEQADLEKAVKAVQESPSGPTLVVVDRAEEPDASGAGQT